MSDDLNQNVTPATDAAPASTEPEPDWIANATPPEPTNEPTPAPEGNVEAAATSPLTLVAAPDSGSSDASPESPSEAHPAESYLQRIEELAVQLGGDAWNEVRHLIAHIRAAL